MLSDLKGESKRRMVTIQEVIDELVRIRDAADALEIRGKNNAALVCYVCTKSDELIKSLQDAGREIQNGSEKQNEPEIQIVEAGEENGQ